MFVSEVAALHRGGPEEKSAAGHRNQVRAATACSGQDRNKYTLIQRKGSPAGNALQCTHQTTTPVIDGRKSSDDTHINDSLQPGAAYRRGH